MDTSQWPQVIGVVKSMEETKPNNIMAEKKAKPLRDQIVNCPRCNSTNTKFCYYNNYSLSQPRYFCKTCRRYWTEGGSLRNVPVGGGSRKNKRSSSSSSNSQSQNPKFNQTHDLNLAYPSNNFSKFIELPPKNPTSTIFSTTELLKNIHHGDDLNITTSMELTSFMPMPVLDNSNPIYTSLGFSMQEFKPTLNFSLDGFENGYGVTSLHNGAQQHIGSNGASNSARLLFPFEELKQVSNTSEFDHNNNRSSNGDSNGYWNGMLNGGGSW